MMDQPSFPFPRSLAVLRWLFVLATLVCLIQTIRLLQAPRHDPRPDVNAYYAVVVLALTGAACAAGWTNKVRAFVPLALASQFVNVFMTGFYVFYGVAALVEVGWVALPHMLPGTIWNLLVFVFATSVVTHLARRYVSITEPG